MDAIVLKKPKVSVYCERLFYRILLDLGKLDFLMNHWSVQSIMESLGLPADVEKNKKKRPKLQKVMAQRYQEVLQAEETDESWMAVHQNITKISKRLCLNEVEQSILLLAVWMEVEKSLETAVDFFKTDEPTLRRRAPKLLASILGLPETEIKNVFSQKQKLFTCGLLKYVKQSDYISSFLTLEPILSVDELFSPDWDENKILAAYMKPAEKSKLAWSDFAHIEPMRDRIAAYLDSTFSDGRKGVNILVYGAPGTGKTEFASLLAEQAGVSCYTLATSGEDDEILNGTRRLQLCTLVQKMMLNQRSLLVFDEAEDVFSGGFFERSVAQSHKAWVNELLENNTVPMVWLSNNVGCMDEAFLRRFDIVLKMPDLPVQHKSRLIEKLAEGRLNPQQIAVLAKQEGLPPAVLERGFKVAAELGSESGGAHFAEDAVSLFNQTLQAQGKRKIVLPGAAEAAPYSPDWISCGGDIRKISEGLAARKRGRICCYGPAGTGKTAWANWLGEQAGLPVLLKQGSDLLGKYVGETEQNIAQAFEQATEQEMMLVIDEADSFLFSRDGAERSWERSMVNEMLTQIERFNGLLVVSTNLMETLDAAVLRRFDLKLHFDFLSAEQAESLGAAQAAVLGWPELSDSQRRMLRQTECLTPGDFAAVFRRHQFAPFDDAEQWLAALQEECALKPSARQKKVGFF